VNLRKKILNLYAGVGGNRKFWSNNYEITSVELDEDIAKIYKDFFPNDKVVVDDAHQYLLDHHKEFDFVWSSPPCPSHSRINTLLINGKNIKPRYPDMKLYEEILFLKHFFKGKWVVENVRSYYKPLIVPQEIQRHYFWSNFHITDNGKKSVKVMNDRGSTLQRKMENIGIVIKNFHNYKRDKRTIINNCIEPELGLHILKLAMEQFSPEQLPLFKG
jgi:DNA (cytosine-5)-methyltransferase 1